MNLCLIFTIKRARKCISIPAEFQKNILKNFKILLETALPSRYLNVHSQKEKLQRKVQNLFIPQFSYFSFINSEQIQHLVLCVSIADLNQIYNELEYLQKNWLACCQLPECLLKTCIGKKISVKSARIKVLAFKYRSIARTIQ